MTKVSVWVFCFQISKQPRGNGQSVWVFLRKCQNNQGPMTKVHLLRGWGLPILLLPHFTTSPISYQLPFYHLINLLCKSKAILSSGCYASKLSWSLALELLLVIQRATFRFSRLWGKNTSIEIFLKNVNWQWNIFGSWGQEYIGHHSSAITGGRVKDISLAGFQSRKYQVLARCTCTLLIPWITPVPSMCSQNWMNLQNRSYNQWYNEYASRE